MPLLIPFGRARHSSALRIILTGAMIFVCLTVGDDASWLVETTRAYRHSSVREEMLLVLRWHNF